MQFNYFSLHELDTCTKASSCVTTDQLSKFSIKLAFNLMNGPLGPHSLLFI